MSISDTSKNILLKIAQLPQNLLIPKIQNLLKIELINSSKNEENVKLELNSDNLNFQFLDNATNPIVLKPKETKIVNINIIPTGNGIAKLDIKGIWTKETQVKVKVQKIKENINGTKLNNILENYHFKKKDYLKKFDPIEFLVELDRNEFKALEKSLIESPGNENEKDLIKLAKAYLSNKQFEKALITANKIPKEKHRLAFLQDLIRAYAFVDTQYAIKYIDSLGKKINKSEFLKTIALDEVYKNPDMAINIASRIDDINIKKECFIEIIQKIVQDKPDTTIELMKYIQMDVETYLSIMLNIIESYWRLGNLETTKEYLLRVIYFVKDKYNSNNYKFIRDSIYAMAELFTPKIADNLIESIEDQRLKERIAKDLFNDIYYLVEEIQTRIETKILASFQYHLNTYSSNINEHIINFAQKGGNLSLNTLSGDTNFNSLFISLFKFDFSVFPIFEHLYSDLKLNSSKSIAYYIFPSSENMNQNEYDIIVNTLKFLITSKISNTNQFNVFNIDFIPYLGKPTLIIGSEYQSIIQWIENKLSSMRNKIDIMIDDNFFAGGKSKNQLAEIFESNRFRIINLILSYEFINDFNIFKELVQILI
ncbi:MAG: hypothetical protein JXA99_00250 [Candidatus Lokiarchaeota archaeon]|nr:hypothetical protein [Candidatus Lokiarchaeota archaeon]